MNVWKYVAFITTNNAGSFSNILLVNMEVFSNNRFQRNHIFIHKILKFNMKFNWIWSNFRLYFFLLFKLIILLNHLLIYSTLVC